MSDYRQILETIATEIEIQENLTIFHPDYPPLDPDPETLTKLKSLSSSLQAKYLTMQIQNYLYDLYFSHAIETLAEMQTRSQQPPQIKNNIIDGIDRDFAQQLHNQNLSNGYLDPGWQILQSTADGLLVVVKDGLHLHINPHQHLAKDARSSSIGEMVEIYLPKNLLGEESYIVVGNFGLPDLQDAVEIYFNLTPDAALAIEQPIIRELNKRGIPFQFEILFNPEQFYRYDGAILCLSPADYLSVSNLLAITYATHRDGFSEPIPLFTKQLAPGVGLAETNHSHTSFGLHRCGVVATALVKAYNQGDDSPEARIDAITTEFALANIEIDRPYLQGRNNIFYTEWHQ
jgi:hypothetical protein